MRLLVVLLLCVSVAAEFNDTLAREIMMPIAAAAYSYRPQQCLDQKMNGAKLSQRFIVECDYFHDMCSGFTFVDDTRKVIGLSFRGTSNILQLYFELKETVFERKVDFKDGGKVSKYFNDAFNALWVGGLEANLNQLIRDHQGYELWITGHSLGGAIASLASAHIASLELIDGDKILFYTFGQPRSGDQDYADVHDNLVKNAFRVVHHLDMVAHVPPEFMKYVHHKSEVFYNNSMNIGDSFIVCPNQEDMKCSDRFIFDPSIDDHQHYYGKKVKAYGEAGCL